MGVWVFLMSKVLLGHELNILLRNTVLVLIIVHMDVYSKRDQGGPVLRSVLSLALVFLVGAGLAQFAGTVDLLLDTL